MTGKFVTLNNNFSKPRGKVQKSGQFCDFDKKSQL